MCSVADHPRDRADVKLGKGQQLTKSQLKACVDTKLSVSPPRLKAGKERLHLYLHKSFLRFIIDFALSEKKHNLVIFPNDDFFECYVCEPNISIIMRTHGHLYTFSLE